jgi:hypothetical protein
LRERAILGVIGTDNDERARWAPFHIFTHRALLGMSRTAIDASPLGGRMGPRVAVGRVVLATVLLGCAAHPGAAPRPTARSDRALACVVADTSAPTRDTVYVVGVDPGGAEAAPTDCERRATANSPVVITETPAPGTDLRDVLDRGLQATHAPRPDILVTPDPNVLAYATSSAGYFTVVLPWSRTYVLVAADSASMVPSQAERDALARDAVTGDARGAAPPFAWLTDSGCFAPLAHPSTAPRPVVAYAAGDAIARQLAERIVALADARTRPGWLPASLASGATPRVAAIAVDSVADALASGRAAAAVVAFARDPRTRCGTSSALLAWRGVPLVDSRAHVIVRRGSGAAFTIGAYGTLRFVRRVP